MGLMLLYVVGVLFVTYLGWGAILYVMQPKFLYGPVREIACTPGDLGLDYEQVVFKSADGLQLSGWYIPAAPVSSVEDRNGGNFTVLFCHGNGGNIYHSLDSINILHELGLNCFIFDYRGYGNSESKPSEKGTYIDAEAAYKWLTEKKKITPDSIIVFGRSLGGSIAAQLVSKVTTCSDVCHAGAIAFVENW